MNEDRDTALIACSLEQDEMADRLRRWHTLHAQAGQDIAPTANGLRLAFRATDDVEAELRALVALEQHCCAFADWSLRAETGQLLLEISASSDEGIAAVQAMFTSVRPAPGRGEHDTALRT
jgi:hypothetical protein